MIRRETDGVCQIIERQLHFQVGFDVAAGAIHRVGWRTGLGNRVHFTSSRRATVLS